jgi:hypothetical protein
LADRLRWSTPRSLRRKTVAIWFISDLEKEGKISPTVMPFWTHAGIHCQELRVIAMDLTAVEQTFRRRIDDANRDVATLNVVEGIDFMLSFYEDERTDECEVSDDGDMLLYQWGAYGWGEGEAFEFDITRQLIGPGGEDENIFQLSLTFRFARTIELRAVENGNRWCSRLTEVESFRDFIHNSAAFKAVVDQVPQAVTLLYGIAG